MPLTMPSTAWSSGASAKTMFAAFPPEFEGEPLVGPGDRALDALADVGGARERDLVHVGWLTSAAPVSPAPVTMLTTPGELRPSMICARRSVSGVVAGFSTTVFPRTPAWARSSTPP